MGRETRAAARCRQTDGHTSSSEFSSHSLPAFSGVAVCAYLVAGGQESAGIATFDAGGIIVHKGMGLVSQVFTEADIDNLRGVNICPILALAVVLSDMARWEWVPYKWRLAMRRRPSIT